MEHKKKKPTVTKKKKGKVIGYIGLPSDKNLSEIESAEQEEAFWSDAIDGLSSKSYRNIEEALEAVVSSAMEKLGEQDEDSEGMKQFLYDVLNMDPEIMDQLRASLQISS